jgi:hypothetical protein
MILHELAPQAQSDLPDGRSQSRLGMHSLLACCLAGSESPYDPPSSVPRRPICAQLHPTLILASASGALCPDRRFMAISDSRNCQWT